MKRPSHACVLALFLSACGGGGLYTTALPDTDLSIGTAQEFALGSDYPAGLAIAEFPGKRATAFIVSVDSPVGVVAIDLDAPSLRLSAQFAGCQLPPGTGLPAGPLLALASTRLLLLTSSHVIDCDPTTGMIRAAVQLTDPVQLPHAAPLSAPFDLNGDGRDETTVARVDPSYPGGMALLGDALYISFGNYLMPIGDPVAAPGLVLRYRLHATAPFVTRDPAQPIVTTAFNPTALQALPNGQLLIVESGINGIVNGATAPQTDSGVEIFTPSTGAKTYHGLGPVALAFQPPAITGDGTLAFFTSAAFAEVYALDLQQLAWLRDHDDPITLGLATNTSDFLPAATLDATESYLFVASFSTSAIYPIRLDADDFTPLPPEYATPFRLGYAAGATAANPSGTNTGVSAVAFRGTTTRLYALTANPGKLVALDARPKAVPSIASPDVAPAPPATGNPPPETETTAPATSPQPPVTPAPPTPATSAPTAPATTPTPAPTPPPPAVPPPPPNTPTPKPALVPLALMNPPATSQVPFADAVASFTPDCKKTAHYGCSEFPANVFGAPHGAGANAGATNSVLSLGCGGQIVLEMTDFLIADGKGADFIVFENAFLIGGGPATFAEPGVVGVSQDGVMFKEFPCAGKSANYAGCAGVRPALSHPDNGIDPTDPFAAGGDAFDLAAVGLPTARFVRIRDVSCTSGTAPNAGFDLDAVSIVWGVKP
ncbi:MAG: hypothetical protein HY696_06520 [Deltaproteobacteria bacterium]|nr:hypothetical protein [Deltaproteobacteria bacterium]